MRKHLNWRYVYVRIGRDYTLCARCAEGFGHAGMHARGTFHPWGEYLVFAAYACEIKSKATYY